MSARTSYVSASRDVSISARGHLGPTKGNRCNSALPDAERDSITKDFPRPNSVALAVPKLDDQIMEHLKSKGKDPNFGSEKSLFRIQEVLLDVTGPLTCLWADLLNEEASVTKQDFLLLVQHTLVLLGSVSHQISQERRKIAWAKINPKSLATKHCTRERAIFLGKVFLRRLLSKLKPTRLCQGCPFNQAH